MILLDLEYALTEFNESVLIKEGKVYLPSDLLVQNKTLYKNVDDSFYKSIFRILILNETGLDYLYTYTIVNPNTYLNYHLYDDVYYLPSNEKSTNILLLTTNDLKFIDAINNKQDINDIEPDSDMLKAYKYYEDYKPITKLGKIIKLVRNIRKFIEVQKRNVVLE